MRQLEDLGHAVEAVGLTGSGPTTNIDPASITIDDHIQDIVNVIDAADGQVVLVAHSYGGRPATGAWDRAQYRIDAVIFLEAVAPYGSGPLALPDEHRQRERMAEMNPAASAAGYLDPHPISKRGIPGGHWPSNRSARFMRPCHS